MGIIVGLDIGTTKVCVCIGEVKDGKIEIVGIDTKPCSGFLQGRISKISEITSSIEKAISKAELMSGRKIESVVVSIPGSVVETITNHGMITIDKNRRITNLEVDRIINTVKAINIPRNMEIIHVLCSSFRVDDQDRVEDPIGMIGMRLETTAYIIMVKTSFKENLKKCISDVGLKILGNPILGLLAGAEAVLSPDEKALGCALIDIGGGITEIAIFIDGFIHHVCSFPIGGTNITTDISICSHISLEDAEKIKKEIGIYSSSSDKEEVSLRSLGEKRDQVVSFYMLSEIIHSRMEEIFSIANKEIERFRSKINAGIVLIGGGSMIKGCVELGKQIFNLPVRLGIPQGINGLVDAVSTPFYAVPVGLVMLSGRFQKRGVPNRIFKFFSSVGKFFRT